MIIVYTQYFHASLGSISIFHYDVSTQLIKFLAVKNLALYRTHSSTISG